MESLRGIGAMATASGLTVSALRFYDGAGVFGPAHVDPRSGYRFYAPDQLVVARLVATLRRVGMPLAGIREVLEHRDDPAAVDALLAAHLRRLERGLLDARRELSGVAALLVPEENHMVPTTVTVRGPELADAIRAVRFAVGSDPELPVLGGMLFDIGRDAVTVVATDRYRMAVAATAPLTLDGPAVPAVLPAALADEIARLDADEVELRCAGPQVSIRAGDVLLDRQLLDGAFPDYRRLLPLGGARRIAVDAEHLGAAVAAGPVRTVRREQDGTDVAVTVLTVDDDGRLVVGDGPDGIAVDVEFLLQATGGSGQLHLELDGPLAPVTIRPAGRVDTFSLLMPVRLDEVAAP